MGEERTNETADFAGQEKSPMKQETGDHGDLSKRRKIRISVLAGGICVLLIAAAAFLIYDNSKIYKECYAEAGVEVTVQDFLKDPEERAYFAADSDVIDVTVPGEYHVKIKTGFFTHRSNLYIVDTIAPQGEPARVSVELGEECEADAFVSDIVDATRVEVSYGERPDFTVPGEQRVKVILTDMGGNQSEVVSELFVSKVVTELTVEAGSRPPVLQDFVIEGESAEFTTSIEGYDYTIPADKVVRLRVDGVDYQVMMHIVDTVAPEVEVRDIRGFTLLPQEAEKFVRSIDDVTKVRTDFAKEPDLTQAGEQTVLIRVTDAGGNETVKEAKLILEEDVEAPVISGVEDLVVLTGSSVSYKKNVTVTDNCPEGLELTVDNSAVNLTAEGTYPITYIATDLAGNETRVAATITVQPKEYDEYEVYALADEVLAKILTPDMTPEEKVAAIYKYNQTHIAYVNYSDKDNWVKAAYEGLAEGRGDCFVYASTAKVLLTRAGIHNIDIAKIPTSISHYWNLVNLGYGWYHFDTTPRASDHPYICMWTEEQLMAYSATHYNDYNYDHSLYPEVN